MKTDQSITKPNVHFKLQKPLYPIVKPQLTTNYFQVSSTAATRSDAGAPDPTVWPHHPDRGAEGVAGVEEGLGAQAPSPPTTASGAPPPPARRTEWPSWGRRASEKRRSSASSRLLSASTLMTDLEVSVY